MLNKIILTFLLSTCCFLASAQDIAINPDHPDSYVVVKGDTLWDIAGRFLVEPWRWPEIWEINPQIENPHLIYPGDVVSLVYRDGQPMLTVDRGGNVIPRRKPGPRDERLSPEIRVHERDRAIPSIPIDAIRHFLSRPLVVEDREMETWPYVVSSFEQHLVSGSESRLYVRGLSNQDTKNYSIYRKGPAYTGSDRYPGDTLGYEAIYVGDAIIVKPGDPATVLVTSSDREILNGDRLAPTPEAEIETQFIPHPPSRDINGNIISVIDGVSQIGQYQIVVLDVGENDGLEKGNVLGIYQKGDEIRDRFSARTREGRSINDTALVEWLGRPRAAGERMQLPEEFAGVIMVFRTFNRISYGLVMEAYTPLHLHDVVKNI